MTSVPGHRQWCAADLLTQRVLDPNELDIRAMVPVSVRSKTMSGRGAGLYPAHALAGQARRPGQATARRALAGLKESRQGLGGEVLTAISEWTMPNLLVQAARLASRSARQPDRHQGAYQPGRLPLPGGRADAHLVSGCAALREPGARRRAVQLQRRPLLGLQRGEWEQIPDLHDLQSSSFRELQHAAQAATSRPAVPVTRRRTTRTRCTSGLTAYPESTRTADNKGRTRLGRWARVCCLLSVLCCLSSGFGIADLEMPPKLRTERKPP